MKNNIRNRQNYCRNGYSQHTVQFTAKVFLYFCCDGFGLLLVLFYHNRLYITVYLYAFLMYILFRSAQFLIHMLLKLVQHLGTLLQFFQFGSILLSQSFQLLCVLLLQLLQGNHAFLGKLRHFRSNGLGHQLLHLLIDRFQFLIDLLHLCQALVVFPQLAFQLIHLFGISRGIRLDHFLGIQLLCKFIHKSIHPSSSKHISSLM